MGTLQRTAARLTESDGFNLAMAGVILVNAAILGLQTYDGVERDAGAVLGLIDNVCLGVFVVELVLRFAAAGFKPKAYFANGWNVFDFLVVTAAFVPGLSENTTLLRLVRLLRAVRIARMLPDARVLVLAMVRSIPPSLSMIALTILAMYIYGMVGVLLFADALPDQWGNVGKAMLTLTVLMTMDNFRAEMDAGMGVHPESWVFFVSYIMVTAVLLLNILLGVVLTALEEARDIAREDARALLPATAAADDDAVLEAKLDDVRTALAGLEAELAVRRSAR